MANRHRSVDNTATYLDVHDRHELFVLREMTTETVHRIQNELQYQVKVELVGLLSVRVEAMLHHNDVTVIQHAHNLKLTVLG